MLKTDHEINPVLPFPLVPVEIVYTGRRAIKYNGRYYTYYTYQVMKEWYAQLATKPYSHRHRIGDVLGTATDIDGKIEWALAVKTGRISDSEASSLLINERVSMTKLKAQPAPSRDEMRRDLRRYRNLYKLCTTSEARAVVLGSIITAIVED